MFSKGVETLSGNGSAGTRRQLHNTSSTARVGHDHTSNSGAARAAAAAPGPSRTRQFLWLIAAFAVATGYFLYHEVQQYSDTSVADRAGLEVEATSAPGSDEKSDRNTDGKSDEKSDEKLEKAKDGSSLDRQAGASPAAEEAVQALRSELASLRELVERHDKMLQDVMARKAQEETPGPAPSPPEAAGAQPLAVHEVGQVNASASEFAPRSKPSRGGGGRKRKESGEVVPVGMPSGGALV